MYIYIYIKVELQIITLPGFRGHAAGLQPFSACTTTNPHTSGKHRSDLWPR